jgi:hypothetical protein
LGIRNPAISLGFREVVFYVGQVCFGMKGKKIEVIFYSGYRGEEAPRFLIIDDRRIEVVQILRMWIEEGVEDRVRRRVFEVEGSDGRAYRLYHDEMAGSWFIGEGFETPKHT